MITFRRTLTLLVAPLAAIAALAATASVAPAVTPSTAVAPAPHDTAQALIIMRDGGVCDPIRHMGC